MLPWQFVYHLVKCGCALSHQAEPLCPWQGVGEFYEPSVSALGWGFRVAAASISATLLGGLSFLPSQSRVTPTPHFTQFCIVNFPCLNYSVVFVSWWICNWEKTINSWGGKKYKFENLKNQCWNIFFMGLSIWFLRVLSSAPFAKTAS